MFSDALIAQAKRLLKTCEEHGLMIASAESCTGGLIAALLTEIPGSSAVFERGFVTYSNAAKTAQLGVPAALIKEQGAVSAQVAGAMAQGALRHSKAHIALAVTGVAGPGGGTAQKPVGLVYIGVAGREGGGPTVSKYRFRGDRSAVRQRAVKEALRMLWEQSGRYF